MIIRDVTALDFPTILALNHGSVQFLSPLSAERLQLLHEQCAYHRVLENEGKIMGFLLAFCEGSAYDSVNYRWFVAKYSSFVYIDRIVISPDARGLGSGKLLYENLFGFAREQGVDCVTCEYDIDPPNEVSNKFHASFGFTEVGQQRVPYGNNKAVSLQAASLKL